MADPKDRSGDVYRSGYNEIAQGAKSGGVDIGGKYAENDHHSVHWRDGNDKLHRSWNENTQTGEVSNDHTTLGRNWFFNHDLDRISKKP